MNPTRRTLLAAGAASLPLILSPASARAAAQTSRAVRIVVAYPPGGSVDIAARLLAEKLAERWGQPVHVENRSGASGTIGADYAAKSAPDGLTLLMGAAPELAIVRNTMRNMPFDVARDFTPIALVSVAPFVLVANPSVPARSVRELVALARAKPGTLGYASSGNGTSSHLTGALLAQEAGIELTHVPYRGSGALMADLLGGHVQMTFDTIPTTRTHIRDGKLVALGAAMPARSSLLPEVPTFAENGLPNVVGGSWSGLLAPAGTPAEVVQRLREDVDAVMRGGVAAVLAERGFEPGRLGGRDFAAFIQAEVDKWARVAQRAGLQPA